MARLVQIAEAGNDFAMLAATLIAMTAQKAVRERGVCSIALSGGSTPKAAYALLAEDVRLRTMMPWSQTHFYWGDERAVPPEHPDSCYRMAYQAMLSKVTAGGVHRIRAEYEPARAASDYASELAKTDVLEQRDGWPVFDLMLLGFGPDGHTASLFPGTKALAETTRTVVPNWVGKLAAWRITLTAPVINQARRVVFLASGDEKALPLKGALEGPHEPEQLPAQLIAPTQGTLVYLLDKPAARLLAPATLEL
ncbi:MAG: 6-phosphogluconolactonase [Pleurocapsa minor GSE-CHR-MK-17-07R]|jgi:6-phosphogluconolactonase|nr:6-phosphogluconolactonase [Pleurocapsa minor GSE-CHR-MK 17-07R]